MKRIKRFFSGFKKTELVSYFGILGGFASIISLYPTQDGKIRLIFALIFLTILLLNLIFQRFKNSRKVPIPSVANMHFINEPSCSVTTISDSQDLRTIVQLAIKNYPCEINGYEYKLEMWKKNRYSFFVVKNPAGIVKANINLLPLKQNSFNKLRDGKIKEQDLSSKDIYPTGHKNNVRHIYVEGLLAKSKEGGKVDTLSIYLIFLNFDSIISLLTNKKSECLICALGGSDEGRNLLKALDFKVAGNKNNRKDNIDFYYIEYIVLRRKLANKNISQVDKKFRQGKL